MPSLIRRCALATAAVALMTSSPIAAAILHVDQNAPTALENGLSWKAAYRTIGGALAVAQKGDEVWVGPGLYREHFTVPNGVALYGGFIGVEARRDQRRGLTDLSVIEADGDAAAVAFSAGASPDTVLDGFTVRGSMKEGGIVCKDGSPTISHNVIRQNGDAAYRLQKPGSGAAGIYGSGPDAVIVSNLVAANTGNGIVGKGHVLNNTVVANTGIGVSISGAGSEVAGNVIARNYYGIGAAQGASISNNCVWGNTLADYDGAQTLTGTYGNISEDPRFAAPLLGNFHLQPDSPCVDAASGAPDALDLDLQPRVIGAAADMGAYESDGRRWRATPRVVRVAPGSNDDNDGSAWDRAKGSVAAALADAEPGTEIWVAKGTYRTIGPEFRLPAFVSLYGGFKGSEAARSQRDPAANETILTRASTGHILTATSGNRVSVVDGFTFTPTGAFTAIGGIWCEGASPIIRRNVVTGLDGGHDLYLIGGTNAAPLITDNVVRQNVVDTAGTGLLFFYGGSAPDMERNQFLENGIQSGSGSAVIGIKASPRIVLRNNVFARNVPANVYGWINGVLVDEVEVVGNTFVANGGPFGSIGLPRSVRFGNNVFVDCPGAPPSGGFNNCYWNSGDVSVSRGVDGNIEANPMFVDAAHDDYRLLPGSPCRDAGLDALVRAGELDAAGNARLQESHVDIGAYEYPIAPVAAARRALTLSGGMEAAGPGDTALDRDGVPGIGVPDAALLLGEAAAE